MRCDPIDFGNGSVGFVCSRGRRPKKCDTPGCPNRSERECDYPVQRRGQLLHEGTCDRSMCRQCSNKVGLSKDGDSVDYCAPHFRTWQEKDPYTFRDIAPVVRELARAALGGALFQPADPKGNTRVSRSGRPLSETSRSLETISIRDVAWKIEGKGKPTKHMVAAELARIMPAIIGDHPKDGRTVIAVDASPIVIQSVSADAWSVLLRFGVGVFDGPPPTR